MGKVIILEPNASDMKFLMTLPKYCDYEFVFTANPSEAITEIQTGEVDVFVCPYEMKDFSAEDLLMTANMTLSRPLCILTSDASDIPNLLLCLNNYSVFKLVVKPFQNILDIKTNIEEAFDKRNKYGLKSEDDILGLIGDSKESAFWESHDRMIDFRFLKIYAGAYTGFKLPELLSSDETSEEGHIKFALNQYIKDVGDSFMRYSAGEALNFKEFVSRINDKYSRNRDSFIGIRASEEVIEESDSRFDLMLLVLILAEYTRHIFNDYSTEVSVTADKGYYYIRTKTRTVDGPLKEVEALKKETSYILSHIADKYSLGNKDNEYQNAAILKI